MKKAAVVITLRGEKCQRSRQTNKESGAVLIFGGKQHEVSQNEKALDIFTLDSNLVEK